MLLVYISPRKNNKKPAFINSGGCTLHAATAEKGVQETTIGENPSVGKELDLPTDSFQTLHPPMALSMG